MSADIVERLLNTGDDWPAGLVVLEKEAADTITTLRAEVDQLKEELDLNRQGLSLTRDQRDTLRAENQRLTTERDRAQELKLTWRKMHDAELAISESLREQLATARAALSQQETSNELT